MVARSDFYKRLELHENEFKYLYDKIYRNNSFYNMEESYKALLGVMLKAYKDRKVSYKRADKKKAGWFLSNKVVGVTLYVDLFSKDIKSFHDYIPYLKELGITFIHFMPILEGRAGENDGGYAVKDYKNIDPKFGDLEEFQELMTVLKKNGISACVDFVVNHTAKEHEFAMKAYDGDKKYQDMYFMYDSYDIPKRFEETVPEVFPGVAPKNFTYYDEINRWVFTSFYEFQWDLNYHNPLVFEKVIDILLYLANLGIDMIRLDAIPFMWKEIGTTCRNHPKIHLILRMMKLIVEIVCPSVALLGEAIVEPEEIIKYFGEEESQCDLMYNATQMVNIWNAIATRDTRLLQIDSNRLKAPKGGCWINYARCHDDIGWGFNEEAIRSMGLDPFSHKQFLINFYKGEFEGSFSIGDLYEFHEETMDARNCGTLASLVGLEKGIIDKDQYQRELAIKRIQLIHGLILTTEGLPLIYSGDEIGALNDYSYLNNEQKAHDSRWLHRSVFDHEKARNRTHYNAVEQSVFQSLKEMIRLRKEYEIFSTTGNQETINTRNHHIYSFKRNHEDVTMVALFNFSEDRQFIANESFKKYGITGKKEDLITGKTVDFSKETLLLGPYEFVVLV